MGNQSTLRPPASPAERGNKGSFNLMCPGGFFVIVVGRVSRKNKNRNVGSETQVKKKKKKSEQEGGRLGRKGRDQSCKTAPLCLRAVVTEKS